MEAGTKVLRTAAVLSAVALAAGAAGCGSSSKSSSGSSTSGGGGTITLKLGYVTTETHPYGQAVDFFAQEVATASNGHIKIVGQPSYPQAEGQLLSDVRNGTEDMGTVSTAIWDSAGINSFQALQAPFLINNYPLEAKVIEGSVGTAMVKDATAKAGDIQVLAIHEGGLRKPVGATKKLTTAASFKGLKIRTAQSKVQAAGMLALGAEADPLPLPEVYQALQNHTVDAIEANLGLIYANKYYEVAKYITGNVNFWPFPTALIINKAKLASLSAADQKILTDAAAKVAQKSLDIVSAKSTLPQQLVNCGSVFVYASPADKLALGKEANAAVTALSKDATTGKFIKQIQAIKAGMPAGAVPPPFPTKKTGACAPPG
ncbi:MAG: TRAP transporter substrate-binding protein [Thermoleophilia bacterium]